MNVTEQDLAELLADLSHLRRQRDELQAHNTKLEERARAAEAKLRQKVDHPTHYQHPSGVECIELVRHMSFNLGNAVKYLWRAGAKGCAATDMRKAAWYLRDDMLFTSPTLGDELQKMRTVVACEDTHAPLRKLLSALLLSFSGDREACDIVVRVLCAELDAEAAAIEAGER